MKKVTRDAFLYMENPSTPEFAQCATCWLFAPDRERCAILGIDIVVTAEDTCGYYLEGSKPPSLQVMALATPEEVGFLKATAVRCENCIFEGRHGTICRLYESLNELPDDFDLDTEIDPRGCCNAFIKG